jgi:hypothetical protein
MNNRNDLIKEYFKLKAELIIMELVFSLKQMNDAFKNIKEE